MRPCLAGYKFVDNLVFETKGLALQDIEGVMADRELGWQRDRRRLDAAAAAAGPHTRLHLTST